MKFSEQLKTVRESLGLNQAEAAAILGCGKRTLEHWEAGTRTPLEITQEGAMNRLRATKRPRTRKGQNAANATWEPQRQYLTHGLTVHGVEIDLRDLP